MTGDVSVEMVVESFEGNHEWMKGGLMLRESLDANARHFSILMTRNGNTMITERRGVPGGSTVYERPVNIVDRQLHLKISKQGNVFQA